MPPKRWDDESDETSSEEEVPTRPVATRRKFDDEEDESDVADNWEEAEDSEVEREKSRKAAEAKAKVDAEAAANKKSKSQRVRENMERRSRQLQEQEEEESSEEDEATKRARLKKSEKDADLRHAEDLLGSLDMGRARGAPKSITIEDKSKPGNTIDLAAIPLFKPASKTQFETLSDTLVPLLRASSNKPHYAIWAPNFVKQILQDLPSTEIKKVASVVTALSNEKMKEEKAADKSGKKTKAAKSKTTLAADRAVGSGKADITSYEGDGLDDGDFM